MTRAIRILGILLVIQALFVAAAFLSRTGPETVAARERLVDVAPEAVRTLTVRDGSNTVTLERGEDGWTIGGFPAQADKVNDLLDQLANAETGFPAGATAEAAERFKVAESGFEREVRLQGPDVRTVALYFGKGAGAGRTYVRRADAETIFAIDVGTYALPVEAGDWQDKSLLRIGKDTVREVRLDGLTVRRVQKSGKEASGSGKGEASGEKGDGTEVAEAQPEWRALKLKEGERFDADAFSKALGRLTGLRFAEAMAGPPENDPTTGEPTWTATLVRESGERKYTLYPAPDEAGRPILTVSDRPDTYFALSNRNADTLKEDLSRTALVAEPSEDEEEAAGPDAKGNGAPETPETSSSEGE